jgi:hypothetical protein
VDAVQAGSVQGQDLNPDVLDLVVKELERRTQTATGPKVKKARQELPSLHRAKLFFETEDVDDEARGAVCAVWRATPVQRHAATYFVVDDPTHLRIRSSWACGLLGAWACDAEYVATGGRSGIAIGHRAYGMTRRSVWMSSEFRERQKAIVEIIEQCAPKWKIVQDDEMVRIATSIRRAPGSAAKLFALVTKDEKQEPRSLPQVIHAHKYLLTEMDARKLVLEHAPLKSADGFHWKPRVSE